MQPSRQILMISEIIYVIYSDELIKSLKLNAKCEINHSQCDGIITFKYPEAVVEIMLYLAQFENLRANFLASPQFSASSD